ncbi:MAG: AfsR family transcriptional regulator [Catenulispora sp.]|nr:AfsR family transcriptional regulator [Catenulispora sp.]
MGPLEAHDGPARLDLGPLKQRIVLGLLLCRANKTVAVSELSDALWDDEPPVTARKNLATYVSALRRTLRLGFEGDGAKAGASRGRLSHRGPGYVLEVEAEQVDVLAFDRFAAAGRGAARRGDTVAAARDLGRAVRLWRGPALAELQEVPAIAAEAEKLTDRYLAAYEDWVEAELALGRHAELVEDLAELVRDNPFRERLRHAQMLALYRCGRQAEALAQFDAMRLRLARDLGLRPSPVLARLYEAILAADRNLLPEPAGRQKLQARSTGAPTRLFRDLDDFTGRGSDLRRLLAALGAAGPGRIAVITGPVGIGKTALAAHCAHRLGDRFPGGRVAVRLRAPDGGALPAPAVLGELLRGVGTVGALPRGTEARAALLREHTAGGRTLFVLDDVASGSQASSILALVGDSSLILTARRLLGAVDSAVHVRLGALAIQESLALLERIIGPQRIAADPGAARRLMEFCDGLPLAVRIVGLKLAGLRHLTLARYAGRLADEDRRLDELAVGGLDIRPRLAAAYRDLEREDQRILRYLAGTGRGEFSAADVSVVSGAGGVHAERAVERLVEANFVVVGGGRPAGIGALGFDASGPAGFEPGFPEVELHSQIPDQYFSIPTLIQLFLRAPGPR